MQVLEHCLWREFSADCYPTTKCFMRGTVASARPLAPWGRRLRLLAPGVLVEGNLSVRLKKPAGDVFVEERDSGNGRRLKQ
jgi:hypothetical protein